MSDPIPLAEPLLGGNARRYLDECVTSNFVSSVGPFVDRFEAAFAGYVGSPHAIACSSGTAALHVAMRLLEVGPGDEVIVPTLTFIATANPVRYQGATPVLIDSAPGSWHLDPEQLESELARRDKAGQTQPKAVVAVHLLGQAMDLAPVIAICGRYGIPLVEDAAESLGAVYRGGGLDGRHVGTLGRIGCYSFNGNKLVTAGGGGMIATADPVLAKRAKHLTTQARLPGPAYWHDEVGYNYRLTNLAAALGLSQLEQIGDLLARKAAVAARYDAALAGLPGIELAPATPWASSSHWLYTVLCDTPERQQRAMRALTEAQIQARPIWTPLHRMAPYAEAQRLGGGIADDVAARALSLPCSAGLIPAQQERVIAVMARLPAA
jgi:dTDP-4-amino-4,6-dideoxygalactose transaminase